MKCIVNLAVVLMTIFAISPTQADDSAAPNVVLIISDDQGFTDYGFMGSEIARTPNLDRIAAESLLYTRGYVMPVCSPSLASLLTGRLPHVHGITGNDLSAESIKAVRAKGKLDRDPLSQRLLANSPILPKTLGEAGYQTFQTGKLWNVTAEEIGFSQGMTNTEGRHGGAGLSIGRESMQPIYDFIEDSQAKEKPFFVWYAPLLPHQPHNPPQKLLAHYQNQGLSPDAAKYFAMVEWFDQTCGELDDYLTDNNLADNTVVIYLADNGWDANRNGRAKLSPFEKGIRTPIFVRWPGKVQPQRDDETLASILDIMPTIFSACGLDVPADLSGINLVDREAMQARKSIFVEGYTHDIADLAHPEKSLVTQVVINGWDKLLIPGARRPDKEYTSAPASIELFDLKADPLEKRNLVSERPEVVARLTQLQNAEWDAAK
ncbi:sulfatase family protein [Allorhodopirellula heiligendammensis]|uniref:Arylsulfatase n=1 Tax=Allorhodopirellula heiligendammensis TaxID=2714739 RepID=A0A5C6BS89_9BACT|nr:sulfatase-like hydrolase/transferase [Allorhodopirellula heiligendammensis]TWU15103.1 Arylsulfatase [Allorhodopirellula heiligendammensis]